MVSSDWSVTRQRVFIHCNWFWCPLPAFLGLELKYNWGLDVICGEEKLPWGQGSWLLGFAPSRRSGSSPWWPSAPGYKLLSYCVSCQLSVSVFLFYVPRNFPSFSLSCIIWTTKCILQFIIRLLVVTLEKLLLENAYQNLHFTQLRDIAGLGRGNILKLL